MPLGELASYFPDELSADIMSRKDRLTEIRIRAGKKVQLVSFDHDEFIGQPVTADAFRKMMLRMMDFSYYTREEELKQGFFTLRNGCRVGVSGTYADSGACAAVGSMCVRVARAVPGCANELMGAVLCAGQVRSTLILSLPGYGKTSMLRDIARQLSENGRIVGIADERHEIAACIDGLPTMDVGPRTDILDGLPKAKAIELLIRSMSPHVVITDEIGSDEDASALRESVRKGVAVIASAHAASIDAFERGNRGFLLDAGLFSNVVLLADAPGHIREIRRYER